MGVPLPLVCAVLFVAAVFTRWLTAPRYKLPPGPSTLPVIGSAHHLPLAFQEYAFWDWRKKYGDVIFFKLFRTPTLVLNSLTAARDLLDKRSAKYSDRPRLVLMCELIGYGNTVPVMHYGDRFRRQRKWIHDAMAAKGALESYQPLMLRNVHVLLHDLLDSPAAFNDHLYKYVSGSILEITYGRRMTSVDDEIAVVAERALHATNISGSPGSLIVDFFPFLKHMPSWMPGAGFKRRAMRAHDDLQVWQVRGVEMVKEDMASGKGSPCVTSALLEAHKAELTEEELSDIRGTGIAIYGAGTETTHGSLATFFLAMTRHPEALQKAQEEMDGVVGRDRLPTFADRDALPYLNALLEELYRWRPGISLALPHRLMAHDEYRGFDIPAGCMVMPNIWGMSRNTDFYPEPEEFRPERHLAAMAAAAAGEKATGTDGQVELPSSFTFGFGRRVCPGQVFADRAIWLAIAHIVAAFDIRRAVDASGNEVVPPAAFKPSMTAIPEPFLCKIVPRSEKIAETVLHFDTSA